MRSLHSHSFCWAFCLSFASVITWFLPPLSEQASARSPIPITFVASSGDDRSDESIQVVYNYNQTSEAIRFLEPAKRMANALGVSDKLSDLSFDLGLFFADEYSDPFFALESGTTHLAEIWGVQVVIDVFNVTDFQPYFEWVRRTTEDPDVLSFYQQIEDSPASFYQFDCWVRTFDGQEFLLSAISLVSDQRNVPLSLASNNRFSNTKQQTCKLSWLTTVLMPEELTPPAPEFPLPGAPDTPHAFAQAISQPEIFDIIIQAPDDSGCTAYCTHCPPGSVNLAFCPGCLHVEYAESLQRQKTIYFNAMQQQREDFEKMIPHLKTNIKIINVLSKISSQKLRNWKYVYFLTRKLILMALDPGKPPKPQKLPL